ncbi:hypothetical protein H310_01647 [Aphanomyces invadans]|uniref:Uncharacterized protein n=1 Tax=Aphanomyces invadans TaxID=157072 RepID=A0A024UTJ0_9STRA|nr:hypothetical protein H310_01647 [Aphanomyces invadans]ETW09247.1 hypothetical protein H310_01647 [Aphanomyces invadans]|eukprot:XP_008863052.1 hypothetical protein H310_01647 [Aphanomyces invadans]
MLAPVGDSSPMCDPLGTPLAGHSRQDSTSEGADSMWYFCPALDAFQVELGADIRDAFLSPSKQIVPVQSDMVLPILQGKDLSAGSPLSSEKAPTISGVSPTLDSYPSRPERRPSSSSSDDSGMADDEDDDDAHGPDELAMSSGEPQTTGRWTKQEHELFLEGLRRYGKSWKSISNLVVTRTLVQIRTHAQKYLQKQSRSSKAGLQYLSGPRHLPRHPLPFHHHGGLPSHVTIPPSFMMAHQQQQQHHLQWGVLHDPTALAYHQDAIYRHLLQQHHRQHLHNHDNNALDHLLDHSDDENDKMDGQNAPNNNNTRSDDDDGDDDDELPHMMMACVATGHRRSSAPAASQPSTLKHLAPSPDMSRRLKRRRLDPMQQHHAVMAYLDPAVSQTPSSQRLSPQYPPTQQLLGTPCVSALHTPHLI